MAAASASGRGAADRSCAHGGAPARARARALRTAHARVRGRPGNRVRRVRRLGGPGRAQQGCGDHLPLLLRQPLQVRLLQRRHASRELRLQGGRQGRFLRLRSGQGDHEGGLGALCRAHPPARRRRRSGPVRRVCPQRLRAAPRQGRPRAARRVAGHGGRQPPAHRCRDPHHTRDGGGRRRVGNRPVQRLVLPHEVDQRRSGVASDRPHAGRDHGGPGQDGCGRELASHRPRVALRRTCRHTARTRGRQVLRRARSHGVTTYAVLGTGAIGGWYGALLAQAGHDVHFLCRSDHAHVKSHGLLVESPLGDIHLREVQAYDDAADMPRCGVALVTWKATSNGGLGPVLASVVAPESTVVMMQNGLGNEEAAMVAAGLEPDRLLAGLSFICAHKVGPGHVRHLDYGAVTLAG
ncbi:hypothetical protein FBQ97_16300, partial [Acidobacteria bacterium ACD]|nr:hypothetical protein [Acidobacteria bacterium ACD]